MPKSFSIKVAIPIAKAIIRRYNPAALVEKIYWDTRVKKDFKMVIIYIDWVKIQTPKLNIKNNMKASKPLNIYIKHHLCPESSPPISVHTQKEKMSKRIENDIISIRKY